MKGLLVAVGANCSRGWLTTEHSASSYGLPVFILADNATYAPVGDAMSAQELAAILPGPMDLVSVNWAEWHNGYHIINEPAFDSTNAILAGFQF